MTEENENENGAKLRRLEDLVANIVYKLLPCSTNKSCKEVDRVSDGIKELSGCVSKKFTTLNKWIYGIMGSMILALILLIINLYVLHEGGLK
jgi:hypothetical protein